ncbi:MAG: TlpA family protein disulfide reductase [Candidatus Dormibacteraeota bacterium]|nr:TlpA family protein disulfide reductase [Candidatus Dormibacteraeota bacterium]
MRFLRTGFFLAVIATCLVVMVLVTLSGRKSAQASPYTTASTTWVLPKLQGSGTVTLAQFKGKPLVLDFFASWCTACRAELPDFLGVSRKVAGKVQFAGVDSEENGDGVGMAQRYGVTAWPLARDVGGSQLSGLRESLETIPGMPVTAFYDASGRVRLVHLGAETAQQLEADLKQLFSVSVS